jgi:uncharacterized coiled-coil protein SlyX
VEEHKRMRIGTFMLATALLLQACSPKKAETAPSPTALRRARVSAAQRAELERRIGRLELSLLEKEAQVDELQSQLEETRQEVVRAMAKLQTIATRAEAASGMAEAEVALQSLKPDAQGPTPEAAQATRLLHDAATEFDQENYGGALYLANQAKSLAAAGGGRVAADEKGSDRPGERTFALPIGLKAVGSGNVREGPGLGAPLAFSVEPGDVLTGYSYLDEWIRITDGTGRPGWIFRRLVARE